MGNETMKQTVFVSKFKNRDGIQAESIAAPLKAIAGVRDVAVEPGAPWTLGVRVQFLGREEARQLQRRVINAITKINGIVVTETITQLLAAGAGNVAESASKTLPPDWPKGEPFSR